MGKPGWKWRITAYAGVEEAACPLRQGLQDIGEGAPPMPQAASWLARCVSCQRENVNPLCFLHFPPRKTGRPSWEPCTVWPLPLTSPPSKSSSSCDHELETSVGTSSSCGGLSVVLLLVWHWDRLAPGTLCCSAVMLAPGHTSPPATKYKETMWDWK